jgi:hypothetical protein
LYKLRDHVSDHHRRQIENLHIDVDTFSLAVAVGLNSLVSYTYKRYGLPRHLHDEFDRQWMMGTFVKGSPYYALKHYVDQKVASILSEADNHLGQPLQTRFRWLDQKYNELEQHIKDLL